MNQNAGVRDSLVVANHLEFAVRIWNEQFREDKPVILALHGWLDNAASFDLLAPLIKEHCVIALDQCGHGKSQHRPAGMPYHFVDYVADGFYVADALGLESFILLGHSLGANVATTMAAAFPERIASLMLIEGFGPATRPVEQAVDNLRASITKFSAGESEKRRYSAFQNLVKARLQGRWKLTEEASELLCARGSIEKDGQYTWSSDPRVNYTSPLRMTDAQASFIRSQITSPTLIIVGEQGIIPNISEDLPPLADFKTAQVERLPGFHHLHLDRRHVEELASVLNRFLEDPG